MRRAPIVIAIAIGLLGLLASAASGSRPASSAETAALASAVSLPPTCIAAVISTADETWAGVRDTSGTGCSPADGVVVLQLRNGLWSEVTSGSSFGDCPIKGVPTPVAKDFRLCVDPKTIVLCDKRGTAERLPQVAPKRCSTLGPEDALAEASDLTGLHWKGWGRAVATASGIELGYHLPIAHIPVHVTAYRLRRQCGNGDELYTRIRVRSRYGTTLVKYPDC